jgi:putative ABC transport system permease protein
MTVLGFIIRNFKYFRRQNLAVMAATIISTAVLTGALIIGDSIRYTLRRMVDMRLGEVRYAMQTGDRFVRSQLAAELALKLDAMAAPILAVRAIASNPDKNTRINKAEIYGVDSSFWQFSNTHKDLRENEVLINEHVAEKLGLDVGNEIMLRIENAEIIPVNTPFSSTQNPSVAQRFTIKEIIPANQLGRFSLKSNQAEPFNIFISRQVLEKKLDLTGLVNMVLLSENNQASLSVGVIQDAFYQSWQFGDIGLKTSNIGEPGMYQLVSDRIFIENRIAESISDHAHVPVLTYMVNTIKKGANENPYSFVSATTSEIHHTELHNDEIVINRWLADDLNAGVGDTIEINFFIIGPLRQLNEVEQKFLVKAVIPIENSVSMRSLMPDFPGMSDAGHCSEWETGVPIDLDKIRKKDEDYWSTYKGTPKAFISIEYGQKLWENQFGNLTALRFDSAIYDPSSLRQDLLGSLKPQDFNLVFMPVYKQGIEATVNAVDFGELFLSLSFFVIVAGVLLTVLVHIFNSLSRSGETALMAGLGFSKKQLFRIKLTEALFVLIPAGLTGALVGIAYNFAIMIGINSVWNDVVRTNMIEVQVKLSTLLIGCISGIFISFVSIWLVNRGILKKQVAVAIKQNFQISVQTKKRLPIRYFAFFFLLTAVGLLVYSILTSIEANSGLFLVSGALFLVALVLFVSGYFDYLQKIKNHDFFNSNAFVLKNAGRNKSRSISSILLLALGAYVILITGANRQTFFEADYSNQSGTGGYLYWAETSLPLAHNLNIPEGQVKMGFSEGELPKELSFTQFFSLEGDDASCLNLNQVQKPRILGINAKEFNQQNSFSFSRLHPSVDKNAPWLSLYPSEKVDYVPAIADQTVLTWGLKKSVGDTLIYLNEKGEHIYFLIVGGLNNSIFQGNLLISDSLFRLHFPSAGGSRVMLMDAPLEMKQEIEEKLSFTLLDYGIEMQLATSRLAEFNSVTNTYLAVFMALGGLGMLIGTIGLGIVLLRNIQERKVEFALMLALGFTKSKLTALIIQENLYILVAGMSIGLISALFGILPSILSPSFEIPGTFIFLLVFLIFVNGFFWIYFPVKIAVKSEITGTLKEE